MRAEATKHVQPGRKNPGRLAAVLSNGGNDLEGEQSRRLEHKEMSATPKTTAAKSRVRGNNAGSRPISLRGRPMTQEKKQAKASCGTAVVWDQASEERFAG